MRFVTDGRRKHVWLPRLDCEQFYDLKQDPGETTDLAPEMLAKVRQLDTILTPRLEAMNAKFPRENPDFENRD